MCFFALCCTAESVGPHQIRPVHVLACAQQFLRRCVDSRSMSVALWHARAGASWKGRAGMASQVQCQFTGLLMFSFNGMVARSAFCKVMLRIFSSSFVNFCSGFRLQRAAKRLCPHGVADHVDGCAATALLRSRACRCPFCKKQPGTLEAHGNEIATFRRRVDRIAKSTES